MYTTRDRSTNKIAFGKVNFSPSIEKKNMILDRSGNLLGILFVFRVG